MIIVMLNLHVPLQTSEDHIGSVEQQIEAQNFNSSYLTPEVGAFGQALNFNLCMYKESTLHSYF